MIKGMLFIDGTWLYSNTPRLSEAYGQQDFRVDFGKLPQVLADEVSKQLGYSQVSVVRTYLFGSYAANYDLRDDESVQRRRDFFDMLREEYHYEVETYPINFMGRRLRKADRDPEDTFEPKEKCVDISLATAMLYYAAIPYVYDVSIAVIGDQDFKPVLQHVRKLGKRVAIASIKGSCSPEYADPRDEVRVKDFDIIWLDELLHRLELKYERHLLACESPIHKGKREVWTTFHPRKGQKFFCDACRREFSSQRLGNTIDTFSSTAPFTSYAAPAPTDFESDDLITPELPLSGLDQFDHSFDTPTDSLDETTTNAPTTVGTGNGTNSHPDLFASTESANGLFAAQSSLPFSAPTFGGLEVSVGQQISGSIKRRIADRGFGFIEGEDGRDYFFHLTDLQGGLYFDELHDGLSVVFEVKRAPSEDRAGAAQRIRRQSEAE